MTHCSMATQARVIATQAIFANGEFRGIFNNGKHVDGQFVFSDGLVYVEDDWKYCTSADRRLHSEMKE